MLQIIYSGETDPYTRVTLFALLLLHTYMTSCKKFQKFIDKTLEKPDTLSYTPILLATSKGNYLKFHSDLVDQYKINIEFHCKPGGRFADFYPWLARYLPGKVYKYGKIVLYIWLGTCDLTYKSGKFIQLRHSSDHEAVTYLIEQINKFQAYLKEYSASVKPIFLEIPPYSIQVWNSSRGHQNPEIFKIDDSLLSHRIALVNEYIASINAVNGVTSIRFRLDLLKVRKSKANKRTSIHFGHYKDGIHPNRILARYWMKRLIAKIFIDCI